MARRADHSREELWELAINTGTQLIERKGFSNFSARGVAAAMGYTVGTLYHVFGSLDEFILQINARTIDAWYDKLSKAAHRAKERPIHTLAHAYIDFCMTNRHRCMALYEHHMPAGVELPAWYKPKMARLFLLAEEMLLPYTGHDRKRARRAAKVLWAGVHGISMLALSGTLEVVHAESANVLAKDLVNSILAGLAGRSTR